MVLAVRLRFTTVLLLAAASCTSSTSLRVQVEGTDILSTATISIFDPYGIIGQKELTAPALPGQVTIGGLADRARQLRVVVAATTHSTMLLGGTRVSIAPHAVATATIHLGAPVDADHDGVPDDLDDCPTVPDPTQANKLGMGPGDACREQADLAPPLVDDLAMPLRDLTGHDLTTVAVADLAMPGPDLHPPPSLCASAGAIFCDGFEAGAVVAPWGPFMPSGSVGVDNVHVYRGDYALHLHQNAVVAGSQSTAVIISTQPYPSPDIYLRAWVYLPSPAPTGQFTFIRVQQSGNPAPGTQYAVDLEVVNDQFATRATRTGTSLSSTTAPPLDRWFCVEYQIHLASAGYTALTVDGNAVSGLGPTNTFDTTNSPTYDWLVIGLDSGSGANAIPSRDLWLDEVVLDNKPISCAR
jgi:hypothetical protein